MSISVNPILPVIAAQGAAPELVLQPGSVIDAQVLKLLSDNLVRIAISSLSIDVLSEIPLQVGQVLQLAVSQTPDGIRLAVVGKGAGPSVGTSPDTVALAPNAIADAAATPSLGASPPPRIELTPLEQMAVSVAAQSAATQQGSQAPLFANLGVAAAAGGLPPKLQQAVMQVLAQQTSLDQNLAGSDVKNAFQKSGLFLEASLASGSVSTAAGMPDLKAALIVLRQTLLSSLGAAEGPPRRQRWRSSLCLGLLPIPQPHLCRMLRRHRRLPHRWPPTSTRMKFFCRRRACRSLTKLWKRTARFFCRRRACRSLMKLWKRTATAGSCSLQHQ